MVVTLQKQFIHFFNIYYFKEFKVMHKYSISTYTFNLSCFAKVAYTSAICLCSGLKLIDCTLAYFLLRQMFDAFSTWYNQVDELFYKQVHDHVE